MSEISITDITNTADTGYFDELMKTIESHINTQYTEGRIKGSDYANVYLGSIQYALQQAFQFGLQKTQLDSQIKIAEEQSELDKALKAKQIEQLNEQIESLNLEDVIKEGTYGDTLINTALERQLKELQTNDALVTSNKQREKIDEEIESLNLNDTLKQEQHDDQLLTTGLERQLKELQTNDSLVTSAKQREQIDNSISVTNTELEDKLLSTALDRDLKQVQSDEQITASQHDRAIKQTDLDDRLLTSTKQRLILETEEELKQYEVGTLLPEQLRVSQFNTELANLELNSKLVIAAKEAEQIDTKILISQEELALKQLQANEQVASSQHKRALEQRITDMDVLVKEKEIGVKNEQILTFVAERNTINQKFIGRIQA